MINFIALQFNQFFITLFDKGISFTQIILALVGFNIIMYIIRTMLLMIKEV